MPGKESKRPLLGQSSQSEMSCSKFWSYLSMAGKFPGFVGDAYWLGLLIDLVGNLDEDVIGLSYPALVIGTTLSLFSTLSAMYCDYRINVGSQTGAHNLNPDGTHYLSKAQLVALIGYALDQISDKASAIGLVAHLIAGKVQWSSGVRIGIQFTAILFGGITSKSDIETARVHLKGPCA